MYLNNDRSKEYFKEAAINIAAIPAVIGMYSLIEKYWDYSKHNKLVNLLITSAADKKGLKAVKIGISILFGIGAIGNFIAGIAERMTKHGVNEVIDEKVARCDNIININDLEDEEDFIQWAE